MEYLRKSLGVYQEFLESYVDLSFCSTFYEDHDGGDWIWCMKENDLLNTPWEDMIVHVNTGMGRLHRHNEGNVVQVHLVLAKALLFSIFGS